LIEAGTDAIRVPIACIGTRPEGGNIGNSVLKAQMDPIGAVQIFNETDNTKTASELGHTFPFPTGSRLLYDRIVF
jgi:hypothetical protein